MDGKVMYNDVLRYLEINLILKLWTFVSSSQVCPETTLDEWLKILCYMHEKGWVYNWKKDGKLVCVVGAYRIKEFTESTKDVLPDKEEGDILYIPFAVSEANDPFILKKMLEAYLKKQSVPVKEIILYERNSDEKIRRFKLKGDGDVEQKSTITSGT